MTPEQQKMVNSKLYTRQPESEPPVRSSKLVVPRKKRVVFEFDENSKMEPGEFERIAREQGWKIIEIQTSRGTVRIPDLR